MDVRHLILLRELADRGSVAAVAAATHRTPSAVSQQIRTAQREFGTPLVEPHGRGVRLTEAGHLLADGGRDIARAIAEVQASWDTFRGQPTGRVSIAALPSAATFLLPGVLQELSGTTIDLDCTDLDIAEAEYGRLVADHDIVIAHSLTALGPAGTAGHRLVELVREPLDIAMRTGHPLTACPSVTADQIVEHEWYGVPIGYPFDTVRVSVEHATGKAVRIAQRLRDNRLVEALVANSDRLAVLPRFTTPTELGVTLRPLAGVETGRYVFAVMRPDRAKRLAVRRVLEAFLTAARAATASE